MRRHQFLKAKGFTFVELLMVIVLLGILSAAIVSRIDINPFRVAGFEQELRSALRFAQKFAIVSGCEVEVDVSAAGYALRLLDNAAAGCPNPMGDPLNNPTGGTFTGAPPAGVTLGIANFIYDRQGRPSAGASITVGAQTITVEPGTGYVH